MYDWLQRNDRDMSDCGLGSPVRHLARNGMLGENLLAVHANLLADGDAALLGKHRVPVVHCPRSHGYFQHPPFQCQQLAEAGVNICLGTDSLATVRTAGKQKLELNLFEEMRALAAREPELSASGHLRMATVNGARALGLGWTNRRACGKQPGGFDCHPGQAKSGRCLRACRAGSMTDASEIAEHDSIGRSGSLPTRKVSDLHPLSAVAFLLVNRKS